MRVFAYSASGSRKCRFRALVEVAAASRHRALLPFCFLFACPRVARTCRVTRGQYAAITRVFKSGPETSQLLTTTFLEVAGYGHLSDLTMSLR